MSRTFGSSTDRAQLLVDSWTSCSSSVKIVTGVRVVEEEEDDDDDDKNAWFSSEEEGKCGAGVVLYSALRQVKAPLRDDSDDVGIGFRTGSDDDDDDNDNNDDDRR
jgi:hypothetical protein